MTLHTATHSSLTRSVSFSPFPLSLCPIGHEISSPSTFSICSCPAYAPWQRARLTCSLHGGDLQQTCWHVFARVHTYRPEEQSEQTVLSASLWALTQAQNSDFFLIEALCFLKPSHRTQTDYISDTNDDWSFILYNNQSWFWHNALIKNVSISIPMFLYYFCAIISFLTRWCTSFVCLTIE